MYTDIRGARFGKINRTLKNKATHINNGLQLKCKVCGKHDDDKNHTRLLVVFWECNICKNWNPMLTGGENGVYGCPGCSNEFDTKLY